MHDSFGLGVDAPPSAFQTFFVIMLVVVIGIFAFVIIRGLETWVRNNQSEVLTRPCKVVAKRQHVWGGSGDSSAHTSYFITFEFEDSSRLELPVRDNQFGLIAEGDIGMLTYQGTRFLEFMRN
jgi:hypothetical protein